MAWCNSGWASARFRHGPSDQRDTAGKLTRGSSLNGATDSSVMYLDLCTAHSSFCSCRMAPTRRVMASSLGKMRRPRRGA